MTTRRVRPAARAVAGLICFLILAGLTGGLPAALYAVGGSPIPHAVPSWHQVILALSRPDNGTLALATVRSVSWLAWTLFAISAAVEAFSRARGRAVARLPVISSVQGFAAGLVSTAVLGLLPGPQLPRPAAPLSLSALAVATAPDSPGQLARVPATGTFQVSARAGSFPGGRAALDRDLHREVPGDNLPDLAARRLGNGEDWREIAALNRGRPEPAGRRGPLPQHYRILSARWKGGVAGSSSADSITAPPDTTVTRACEEAGNPAYTHYTVRDGDNLWNIALTRLGNGERWHQIYALNAGRPQPDGQRLVRPGLIQPGWILRLPAEATAASGNGHVTDRQPPVIPAAGRSPRPRPEAAPGPQPSGRHSPSPAPAAHRSEQDAGNAVSIPWGGLIGTGLASAVTGALVLAGLQRRRRYQPARIVTPSLESGAVMARPLIGVLRQAGRQADTGDQDQDTSVPAGHTARGGGAPAGTGQTSALLAAPPRAAAVQPPGVISLGLRDGQEITADITDLGGLGLTGPGTTAAARALLLALLSQAQPGAGPHPAEVFVPAADAATLIPGGDLAGQPGLTVTGTLNAALDHLEAAVLTRARITATTGDGPDPEAEPATPPPAGPAAVIATPDPACNPRLAAILQMGQGTGVAAILLGDWPGGVTCQVAADGTVTAAVPPHPVFSGLRLFHLTWPDAAAILTAFREAQIGVDPWQQAESAGLAGGRPGRGPGAAHPASGRAELQGPSAQSPHPDPGDAGRVPSAPDNGRPRTRTGAGDRAASAPGPASPQAGHDGRQGPADGRVQVTLLGPPQITVAGTEITGGLRKARELLAFLAVHADGATGDQVSEALWPAASPGHGAAQRNIALRKLRELLRTATGFNEAMFVVLRADRYRLDPALFDIDIWRFQRDLLAARQARGEDAQLTACREAVAAYHGPLADQAGYDWAEPYAEQARCRALDAWTRIAEITATGDPEEALATLETALGHDPYNEFVYQKIMRLQAAAGRPDAVRRTLSLLETRLTELGVTPGPQTRTLAASLLGSTTAIES